MDERRDPPTASDEVTTLLGFVEYLRGTILWKTEGLDADQLAQRLAPSTMTLGGLLKHLAGVEDWWLSCVLLGHDDAPEFAGVDWSADPDWEWHSATEHSPEELRAMLTRAIDRSRAHVDRVLAGPDGLDTRAPHHGEEPVTLRWILFHLIEEYGRHCGHADLLREAIDGTTGE